MGKQDKKVEVSILNQVYTFVGEDEKQIVRAAEFVDARIRDVIKDYSIVNTFNAMMMAMMRIAAEYLEVKERVKKLKEGPVRLLYCRRDAAFALSCSTRTIDYWVEQGLIRAFKLGRKKVAIPASEVERIASHGLQGVRG